MKLQREEWMNRSTASKRVKHDLNRKRRLDDFQKNESIEKKKKLSKSEIREGVKPVSEKAYQDVLNETVPNENLQKLQQFDHDKIKLDSFILVVG